MGISPERALWMTPRDMEAAAEGHGKRTRSEFVMMARAFGADLSEREAKRIIEGERRTSVSLEEHDEKLQDLAQKHGWDL
jgi:hypothetical protein